MKAATGAYVGVAGSPLLTGIAPAPAGRAGSQRAVAV